MRSAIVLTALALLASCGGGEQTGGTDGALGGDARVVALARTTLDDVPEGPLAWIGWETSGEVAHEHGPAFVYASSGPVTVDARELAQGEGAFVDRGHSHGPGPFWEIVLATPGSGPPRDGAEQLFESPPLDGIREPPVDARFLLVEMPPGSRTSVHSHPGSEFIYVTEGTIDYQSGVQPTIELAAGESHDLPPNTAVQKRNPDGPAAAFLSWFLVEPDRPFAPPASF